MPSKRLWWSFLRKQLTLAVFWIRFCQWPTCLFFRSVIIDLLYCVTGLLLIYTLCNSFFSLRQFLFVEPNLLVNYHVFGFTGKCTYRKKEVLRPIAETLSQQRLVFSTLNFQRSIPLTLGLTGRDGGLSTLCHSCGFACQQRVLKNFLALAISCPRTG